MRRRVIRKRIAAHLYRHPRLHRASRRVWHRVGFWRSRAGFQLFRVTARIPEPPLSLDPSGVRLRASEASAAEARWEASWKPISDDDDLRALARAALAEDPCASDFYRSVAARIAHGEQPYGLADRRELDEEIASLREPRDGGDIEVWIGESGRIGLRRGLLALALARERRQPAIRARVAVRHPAWRRLRSELAYEARHRPLYQKVLHPDLELFPALQACVDRIAIVEHELPRNLRTALDLGASYGQFSRFLEDQGFRVTAAEDHPATVHLLRRIRDTMGYSFEIHPADVRAYRPSEPVDVLWAMSVLHFFTKNEADERSLAELLGRLRPKVVFFQPPRGDEYGDRGWGRIYEPNEFAERVRDWCGLTRIDLLGMADNGRPIYRLS